MGNSTPASPPPLDARVLRCKEIFMLNQGDIGAFWGVFKQFDPNGEGRITREAFFEVIDEERNKVGDAIFALADAKYENQLEFGDFVQAVSSFCCLSVPDMLKFCFIISDKNHSGFIEIEELHDLITVLHSSDVSKNVQNAISNLKMDEYGRLSFESFKEINNNFPQVLYPIFRLQQSIKRRILGIKWWKRKVDELDNWRKNKERLKQAEKTMEDKRRIRQRNAQIRKVMGIKEYFFNPKKRQIYVEALSQNVPDVTQLGTTVATSDDLLKAAAPSVR